MLVHDTQRRESRTSRVVGPPFVALILRGPTWLDEPLVLRPSAAVRTAWGRFGLFYDTTRPKGLEKLKAPGLNSSGNLMHVWLCTLVELLPLSGSWPVSDALNAGHRGRPRWQDRSHVQNGWYKCLWFQEIRWQNQVYPTDV